MQRVFDVILLLIIRFFMPRHNAHIQFLRAQVRILRARIPAERIVPTPEEKAELLRWGALFGHDVDGLLEIVRPATYRRWWSNVRRRIGFRHSGRPRIVDELCRLVASIAVENVLWGYRRIVGELKKLGIAVGPTTVKRILAEQNILPAPEKARKKPPMPWTEFVRSHLDVLSACDFFVKPVYTLFGSLDAYVLVFYAQKAVMRSNNPATPPCGSTTSASHPASSATTATPSLTRDSNISGRAAMCSLFKYL